MWAWTIGTFLAAACVALYWLAWWLAGAALVVALTVAGFTAWGKTWRGPDD